jgi:uncharacterized protein (TIGR00106 family)
LSQREYIVYQKAGCAFVRKMEKSTEGLMAIAELSIVPIGTESTSLSSYVAACVEVLKDSGLIHEVHGMGTIIEGELKEILDVVLKMHEVPFKAGALRVVTSIKIDDRRDKEASAKAKVESVVRKSSRE